MMRQQVSTKFKAEDHNSDTDIDRVSSRGFIPEGPLSFSTRPAFPEEALFRRKGAPDYLYGDNRGEGEEDLYWANEDLSSDQMLPDTDLLKAVHVYTSDFYHRATSSRGQDDFRSMDGTALLALGILLEETAKHYLGEKGHLVFVEGDENPEESDGHDLVHGIPTGTSKTRNVSQEAVEISRIRERKRRKLDLMDRESSSE